MQIIDDLTQAETLNVSVSNQVAEITQKLTTEKNLIIAGPAFWGKSTLIDGLFKKWEKDNQPNLNSHILDFDNNLFLSDLIFSWYKFLQNSLQDCAAAVQTDIEKKFPQLFEDSFTEYASEPEVNQEKLLTLAKATVRLYKKAGFQNPLVISGFHLLAALKKERPIIEAALIELLTAKHSPKIIIETQYEQQITKKLGLNELFKETAFCRVTLPTQKKWLKALGKFLKKKNMKIADEVLLHLVEKLQNHPLYIKEAVNKLIVASKNKANTTDVDEIIDQMLLDYNPALSLYARTLTPVQTSYLCAIARGETTIYAKENLNFYQLGTSANVAKMKRTFLEREILIYREEKLQFIDPMLSLFFATKPLLTIDR